MVHLQVQPLWGGCDGGMKIADQGRNRNLPVHTRAGPLVAGLLLETFHNAILSTRAALYRQFPSLVTGANLRAHLG